MLSKNSFKLLDCDENLSNCLENWKIEENKNAIHSKLKNPESHFIGNFNNLNDLLYVLNNNKLELKNGIFNITPHINDVCDYYPYNKNITRKGDETLL